MSARAGERPQGGDALSTRLCALLGCRWPIVQTAMGWVADPALVAATGNAGGFGFLAGATIPPAEAEDSILRVKALSERPFGVNFHMHQPNASEIVELAIKHGVRAVSYSRSPDAKLIERLKRAGVVCMPTVGALRHAVKAVALGADALTVQGSEGGGHTGPSPTTVLLSQVLDAVDAPVCAAGGFRDGRGLAAALAWGADGIAMGTRFLLTSDSPVPDATKRRYLGCDDPAEAVVSTALDGLPHRMIRNAMLRRLESGGGLRRWLLAARAAVAYRRLSGASAGQLLSAALAMRRADGLSAAQAMMSANSPFVIQRAMVDGRPEEGALPGGQVVGAIDDLPSCERLIADIAAAAERRLAALSTASGPRAAARSGGGEPTN